jgi:acyl-CoA reductase-like NAD-dependent aldehyde dehydrogenase
VVRLSGELRPGQAGGQVGPVIDMAAKERIINYINEAEQSDGARVLLDGRTGWGPSEGSWVGPTILLHSSAQDRGMREEIFGPVLSVIRVGTWDEAIAIVNSNPYGNAACIYTERGAVAEWFTSRFRAAMLGVNIGIPVPREPFSFGGLYGTDSKYGTSDITGDGAMEFFSSRRKVTSKWSASYASSSVNAPAANGAPVAKKMKMSHDAANFDGKM